YWYTDIQRLIAELQIPWLATLNSGLLYFRRSPAATAIFRRTREVYESYESLGFDPLRDERSDEPCFGVALSEARLAPTADDGRIMRTPIGIQGSMDIDVLRGTVAFTKHGTIVSPAVVHFATWQFHPVYYRERAKLRLYFGGPMRRLFARVGA